MKFFVFILIFFFNKVFIFFQRLIRREQINKKWNMEQDFRLDFKQLHYRFFTFLQSNANSHSAKFSIAQRQPAKTRRIDDNFESTSTLTT